MMCKLCKILYISLVIVALVECYNAQDESSQEVDVKVTKHHSHHTKTTLNEISSRNTNDDHLVSSSTSTEELLAKIKEKDSYITPNYDKTSNTDETTTETTTDDNIERSGETTNDIQSSLMSLLHDGINDFSDQDNYDKETSKTAINETEPDPNLSTEEILANNPKRNTLSQVPVLDLKARTGKTDDDEDANRNDVTERETSWEKHNADADLRSGYVAPNAINDIYLPPSYNQQVAPQNIDIYPYHPPKIQYQPENKPQYQTNWQSNTRQENAYNNIFSKPRYPTPIFEGNYSPERFYPVMGSKDHTWGQGNNGQTNPYYNIARDLYNFRSRDRCPSCMQSRLQHYNPLDQTYRRSDTLESANGRSMEVYSSDNNAYPLVKNLAHELEETNRAELSRSNEFMYPNSKDLLLERKEKGLIPKVLPVPPYLPRSNSLLRRVGLGGLPKVVL